MCEELNLNTEIEETPQPEQPIAPPVKLPMEQWWGEDREETDCVDVTPELPPQPTIEQPQPQYTYPQPPEVQYYQPQPPYYQPPYMQPAPQQNDLSLVSLVLGIVALVIGFIPFFGWITDIAAIVTGTMAKSKGDKTSRGTLGIVFGAVGVLLAFIVMTFVILFLTEHNAYY